MKLAVGDHAEMSKCLDKTVVEAFAAVAEDFNPIHLDDEFAAQTPFGQTIVHGMLAASLLSGLLAGKLPGPGSVYRGQEVKFVRPIMVGETVTARVEVEEIKARTKAVILKTQVFNEKGELAVNGKATALVPHLEV